jgi:hypothetical protein
VRTVVIGASIEGQAPTAWRWDDFDEELGDVGAALRMVGVDYVVSYDLRADNVFDGFRPRPADDDTTAATFLIAGCHMTYIRDDAIENDRTMSGVIDDCLFDGINMGLSEQQGDDYPNPRSVVRIQDSVFIFRPMPHDRAGDGRGHARMFKWSAGAGKVDMRRVVICYRETPISLGDSSFEEWPRGEFANITVVLGPDYDGDRDGRYGDRDHPGRAPRGVAVTRDWSVCNRSRSAWLDAH